MIPCLVEAFDCDETIHPDIYDVYAISLFNSLESFLDVVKENLEAIQSLMKGIYYPYFETERYEEKLRDDVFEKVVSQLIKITSYISKEEQEKLIIPII